MFCYPVIIAEMVSEHGLHGILSILLCTLFCTLASFHAFLRFKKSKSPRNKKFKINIGPTFNSKHFYQLKLLLIVLLRALLIQFSHASIDRHHSFQSFSVLPRAIIIMKLIAYIVISVSLHTPNYQLFLRQGRTSK